MIRVSLIKLVKRYDRVAAVDLDLPLEINSGEVACILGPSGAGKTTLARLVAGLERPDDGEVFFDGRLMNDVPPAARRVGLVFQDDALWPHRTVAETVAYAARLRGAGRGDRRRIVGEALSAARIDSLAGLRPDALTPLQRRRVALARALAVEPELLIVDEPSAALPTRDRDAFRDELRRLHAEAGATTLVLTSDPREALAMADTLAVMDLGRVAQSGPAAEVYNRPVDAVVAQLLGPTNLLQGQVEGVDARGDLIVRTPLGRLIGHHADAATLPAGLAVTVSIRPESIRAGAAPPAGSNRFAATLERQVFLGEVRELHARGPGDWPVTALALQTQSQGLREGQSLTLSVLPESVVILLGRRTGTPA